MLKLKSTLIPSATAAIFALGLATAAPATLAQDAGYEAEAGAAAGAGAETAAPAPAAAPTEVSDSQLTLYAEAAQKVAAIQQQVQVDMQGAGSTEDAQAIQQQAQEQMVQAVESFGLTTAEFGQIGNAIRSNPELRSKFEQLIQQTQAPQ